MKECEQKWRLLFPVLARKTLQQVLLLAPFPLSGWLRWKQQQQWWNLRVEDGRVAIRLGTRVTLWSRTPTPILNPAFLTWNCPGVTHVKEINTLFSKPWKAGYCSTAQLMLPGGPRQWYLKSHGSQGRGWNVQGNMKLYRLIMSEMEWLAEGLWLQAHLLTDEIVMAQRN